MLAGKELISADDKRKMDSSDAHGENNFKFPNMDGMDGMDYQPPKNKSPIHN